MKNKKTFNLGLTILILILNILLITSVLFIFKIPINIMNVITSIIITIIEAYIIMKKQSLTTKQILQTLITFILIFITSTYISGHIYDTTYDSNTYHKVAVGQLKNGWNPVYESIDEFNESEKNSFKINNNYSIWTDHYAKGYWIYAANIYKITNNIESGKSIYILTIISTFLISLSLLTIKYRKIFSFIISGLIAFNPITICQFGTYYNDGLLGNFLIIMIIALTLIMDKKEIINKKISYLIYFITLIILINIKFTGFAYAGIYSLLYYLYIITNKEQRQDNLKKITITGIIAVIIGTSIIGLSTYPKNIKEHRHPFYPIYGEKSIDIMTKNAPTGLYKNNRFERFFISTFGETYNELNEPNKAYKLKIPFTVKKQELKYFIGPDVRIGGFGVLFSGILVLSSFLYIKSRKKIKNKEKYIIPLLGTAILIIILKDVWWARYIPQFYLIPIIALITNNETNNKREKTINIIFCTLLLINTALIFAPQAYNILQQKLIIEKEFLQLPKEEKEIITTTNEFTGAIYNLRDKHKNTKNVNIIKNIENYKKYNFMSKRVDIPTYIEK